MHIPTSINLDTIFLVLVSSGNNTSSINAIQNTIIPINILNNVSSTPLYCIVLYCNKIVIKGNGINDLK